MAKSRKSRGTYIPEFVIAGKDGDTLRKWGGLNTAIKDVRMLDRGQSPDEMNWITGRDGDNIQLRRGKFLVGTTRRTGGHVTGLNVGVLSNGVQTPIFTSGSHVYYYKQSTSDTAETTTANLLGTAAANDDTSIFNYTNMAGSFCYITSPNSSIFKVAVANPATAKDQNFNGVLNEYRFGYAKADQGVFMGVNRYGKSAASRDPTGFYLGRVETLGTGSGSTLSYGTATGSVPLAPTAVVTPTGSIAANTYYYVITAITLAGVETTKGVESAAVVVAVGGAANIQLTWTKIAGASSYKIYRTTTSGNYTSPTYIGSTTSNSDPTAGSFMDTVVTPAAGAPPSTTTVQIVSQVATGNGATKAFSGTLTFYYVGGKGTPSGYGFIVTDGVESFQDDKSGNLVGSLGGTGTVDYITGAYSVTFATAPANNAPITYFAFAEDPTTGGILDFTINTSDTTGTYAQIFRQDDAGGVGIGIGAFQGIQYVLHLLRTWNVAIGQSGTNRTYNNQPYWSKIGIPYQRAFYETGDGVLFIDNTDAQNPSVSILEIPPNSTNLTVVPIKLSAALDLSGFAFTKAVVYRWGEYDIISCMNYRNGIVDTYNSATFIRNIYSSNWNQLDYTISCLSQWYGGLIMGDFLSPNCFVLFSGFDDDGGPIYNYWKTPYNDLGMEGLKEVDYLHLSGLIQPNQQIAVSISLDYGNYVQYFLLDGKATYVNKSQQVEIGGSTIGSQVIGAGGGGGSVFANPFDIDIPIHTDMFNDISIQFQALQIGHAQIDGCSLKGVRRKQRAILPTQTFGE